MSDPAEAAWAERAAHRSPSVQRSRNRSVQQARVIVDAARRLTAEKGESFTTQELVKEAGVALQTFYRYFGSKDELLLAVIEDMIAETCELWRQRAEEIKDPVDRLQYFVGAVMASLQTSGDASARFVASEHWRLSAMFPDEVALAIKQFSDLIARDIAAATDQGMLRSVDPDRDAWLITQFVLSVFHQQSFAPVKDPSIAEDLWRLCVSALGGGPSPDDRGRRRRR